MAESFAKLSLRNSVTIHDAVMAIFLYEENMSALTVERDVVQSHLLKAMPQPHFPPDFNAHDVIAGFSIHTFVFLPFP